MATLYRYYDREGRLLYVGITGSGSSRMAAHASTSRWWRYVRTARFEHFRTREAALLAETMAIQTERPKFNKAQRVLAPRPASEALARISALPAGQYFVGDGELGDIVGLEGDAIRRAARHGWFPYLAITPKSFLFAIETLPQYVEDFLWLDVAYDFVYPAGKVREGPHPPWDPGEAWLRRDESR